MFLIDMFNKKTILPDAATALPGREEEIPTATTHFVSGGRSRALIRRA